MKSPITVLVVDVEPLARNGLVNLISRDSEFEVLADASNVEDAVAAIQSLKPDLVLLDVQMPDGTGFDVIRRVGLDEMPVVVFVTAYNEFAVDAFEVNAVDYLLKPFDDERFARTLQRAKKGVRQADVGELSRKLVDLLGGPPTPVARYAERIVVKTNGRVYFLRTDEIDWIEAADYYAKIHVGKTSHLLRETMASLEKRLDPNRLFRVHRGAIVNLDRVREMEPYFRGEHVVVLQNGTKLKLSRARRDQLQKLLAASE
jgi:two-component system LytT family response regulator